LQTIQSVQSQTGPSVEHVVVDGGSTDDSKAILRDHLRATDYWLSEPDRGISDAFNKGIALSRGRYLIFLNADDWLSDAQLQIAHASLTETDAEFVFGDLLVYDDDQPIYYYRGDPGYASRLKREMPAINHSTALIRAEAFGKVGLFDPTYKSAMDYDWFYRLHNAGGKGKYDHRLCTNFRLGGISNREVRKTLREVRDIAVANGRPTALADAEVQLRLFRATLSLWLKRVKPELYHRARSRINRSYVPVQTDGV
jgi:glycosyltransferase involved in cell wall biosynthesis